MVMRRTRAHGDDFAMAHIHAAVMYGWLIRLG
jgi:hypothetical protein